MTADHDTNTSPNKQSPSQPAEEWAVVGEVVGAFGIHGAIKVRPLSDFAQRFAVGATIRVGPRHERRRITSSRQQGAQFVLGIEGCETANDAERLRGQLLTIPAADLAPLAASQFYQHDIIGLRVERMNGQPLGVIVDIIPSGATDLYVVRDPATGQERFLPAIKEFIHEADLAAGVMRVTPIPGLFDEGADEAR
ncbi:MAG TPA: ribosome maturation factor RimM [Ktedonobacterales bacterium]